ncbi:MAG: 23S rRNA (uracil(1939)-C(5))-methyltransferase RlmD [Bacteroidetes bacterium]|nr:23S rRNA (uracil(1939)-C(5))-methyltransferase RlmD [Bacteroidota bacterium]MDA1119945.1 23S rRNA (uracil(1939)-C(5))-methyltransferase RlmD [Bacteroidota bacterium]
MGRRKPFTIEKVVIEGIADEGKCVAHHDGMAIFVRDVAPGDIADLEVRKVKRNYLEGHPTHFHEKSIHRVEPICTHFGLCGGCKWQHVSYDVQLEQKSRIVKDALERIAKVELPVSQQIIGSDKQFHYRNKLEYTFSNNRWLTNNEMHSGNDMSRNALGFHIPKMFDKILGIDECFLQSFPTNEIRNAVFEYAEREQLCFYDIRKKTGFLRNLIIRTSSLNEVMVILQVAEENDALVPLLNFISKQFPQITSLLFVINDKMNETFNDLKIKCHGGRDFIWEQMPVYNSSGNWKFKIGPKSFFQTNSSQAIKLYKTVFDFANLSSNEVVYDLYTGTGTIAICASSQVNKVVGIEYVEAAIKDARDNSEINNATNTQFFAGDIKDILNNDFVSNNGAPHVIITDPPRAGMHKDVVQRILEIAPERIVYVSCNPATQARDIALLDSNYIVTRVQPVDMFPHTSHVENVILLVHR